MAYYIFNVRGGDASQATQLLRTKMWPVSAQEPHRDALAPGDLALVYLAAPKRVFIGCAELASSVQDWTAAEAQVYPGNSLCGVSLAQVEEWDPPVPMCTVLWQIDQSAGARADFEAGVVRITREEYVTALSSQPTARIRPHDFSGGGSQSLLAPPHSARGSLLTGLQ
jgi:hypothetical protein